MKKLILIITICILPMIGFSQELGIKPSPQQVEYHNGTFRWKSVSAKNERRIKTQIVSDIPAEENKDQAYIIKIKPCKIILQATTEQGLANARKSLSQLVKYQEVIAKSSEFRIPCMTIIDWPKKTASEIKWQEFYSTNPEFEFKFDEAKTINSIKINFLAIPSKGIILPSNVRVYAFPVDATPDTPDTFVKTFRIDDKTDETTNQIFTKVFKFDNLKTKYLRVFIENPGKSSKILLDEIIIE